MKLLFDIAAVAVIIIAICRIVATPLGEWSHGRRSVVTWIIVSLWLNPVAHGVIIPVAAAIAIWQTHRVNHKVDLAPKVPDLPFAEGVNETEYEASGSVGEL